MDISFSFLYNLKLFKVYILYTRLTGPAYSILQLRLFVKLIDVGCQKQSRGSVQLMVYANIRCEGGH